MEPYSLSWSSWSSSVLRWHSVSLSPSSSHLWVLVDFSLQGGGERERERSRPKDKYTSTLSLTLVVSWFYLNIVAYSRPGPLGFFLRQVMTNASKARSVVGLRVSKSISISSGSVSLSIGSLALMMFTTLPSLSPGSLLMSRLKRRFSS